MVEERMLRLLPHLPPGVSELYLHPASRTTPALAAAMPGYRHDDELAALLSPAVRRRIADLGIALIGYGDLPVRAKPRSGIARALQPRRRAPGRARPAGRSACRTGCRRARCVSNMPICAVPGSCDRARLPKADIVVSALNSTARAVLDCRCRLCPARQFITK